VIKFIENLGLLLVLSMMIIFITEKTEWLAS